VNGGKTVDGLRGENQRQKKRRRGKREITLGIALDYRTLAKKRHILSFNKKTFSKKGTRGREGMEKTAGGKE